MDNFYSVTTVYDDSVELSIESHDDKSFVCLKTYDRTDTSAWAYLNADEAHRLAEQLIEFAKIVREKNG